MSFNKEIADIKKSAKSLVAQIRQLSERQKDLWQKVPYLALKANGRTGYCDNYSRAYMSGYWAIEASAVNGYYTVYVDLETGRLVNASSLRQQARDDSILQCILSLESLNAKKIIAELERAALKPIGSYYDEKDRLRRSNKIKEILQSGHIRPDSYRRNVSPEEVDKRQLESLLRDM